MSNPTTWRLPLAALGVVLAQLLTVAVLMIGADEVKAERLDTVRDAAVTRCGDRP
ncbi:hypothetical protein [Jiangella alkaliphila]|uniref:Uncharacterized protein n=1 Tax=Jiangella alkaliphila TaxID=419479 RepID=A0A1H2ITR7_9ACTN|nr:hypothetical protein [Jiangella alkaliphila]SDU47539.1 hypothetical protein SAMN04488563_2006 [Jiangella alkaliphila]